jgi:hypothetical protein
MHRQDTWEAYLEYAGGHVTMLGTGLTRTEAERRARIAIDFDAHEMGASVETLRQTATETSWITDGTIGGAYQEWGEQDTCHRCLAAGHIPEGQR